MDTEFVVLLRSGIEREIRNKKDDLASGKLGSSVEQIALRATGLSNQVIGLELALGILQQTIKGQA